MAKRMKQKPLRRQPPSQVEREARRYRESIVPVHVADDPSDEALLFDDDMLDRLAVIQQGWDDTKMWLRSLGATDRAPTPAFIAQMQMHASHRTPPITRIFAIDRPRFGFSEWLRGDYSEDLPPDEYAKEVEHAIRCIRSIRAVSRRFENSGSTPSSDAMPVGPAFSWPERGQWMHSPYRSDAPLNAFSGVEFNVGGKRVIRVDNEHKYFFIHRSTRVYRTFPNR